MDERRVKREVQQLRTKYRVKWHLPLNGVVLEDFQYPSDWTPTEAPLLIRLPEIYPRDQPGIYIPSDITHNGPVRHRMKCPHNGWHRWCTHKLDWDPRHHDLSTVLKLVSASLSYPDRDNPYTPPDLP